MAIFPSILNSLSILLFLSLSGTNVADSKGDIKCHGEMIVQTCPVPRVSSCSVTNIPLKEEDFALSLVNLGDDLYLNAVIPIHKVNEEEGGLENPKVKSPLIQRSRPHLSCEIKNRVGIPRNFTLNLFATIEEKRD